MMSGMRVVLDLETVKAGRITLIAENQSKNLVHEVVVVAITTPGKALPYDEKAQKVIESRIRKSDEIADLKPGASGKVPAEPEARHLSVDLQSTRPACPRR